MSSERRSIVSSAPGRVLFGTDGVRDVANTGSMTTELAANLGRAFVRYLAREGVERPRIMVCRDTRRSGSMIEAALTAGMMSEGADIERLGVFPTPGVSYILHHSGRDAGAVISASHNPAEYNGIKFFDGSGSKLTDSDEKEIEKILVSSLGGDRPTGAGVGTSVDASGERLPYVSRLVSIAESIRDTSWHLVVDAANGAVADIAREIFKPWRGEVSYIGTSPDGMNINDGVGVMYLDHLKTEVTLLGARLGIAYDGDADRVLLCDSHGRTIDGDIIMWVVARFLAREGLLGSGLVATVMSNMILEEKLREEGIETFRCAVGDRYVLEKMRAVGAKLGGEQSGHVIASEFAGTGDGPLTGLLFIRACDELGLDIDRLVDDFPRYPQVLKNLRMENREEVLASEELAEAARAAEKRLAGMGRILLRTSGTEPLLRILVEAKDDALMREVASDLERAALAAGERL